MIRPGRLVLAAAALGVACGGDPANSEVDPAGAGGSPGVHPSEDPLEGDAGWDALVDWDRTPTLGASGYRRFSSHDRDPASAYPGADPGNKDFNNFLAVCGDRPATMFQVADGDGPCEPGREGYLIAAADGPGYVSRVFLGAGLLAGLVTGVRDVQFGFVDERVRIYVDDAEAPSYEGRLADWEAGRADPFPGELTRGTSAAVVSYAPIAYASKVRIFIDDLREATTYFYQVDLQPAERTASFDRDAVSAAGAERVAALVRARDADGATSWLSKELSVPAGSPVELLSRASAGTIRRVSFALDGADSSAPGDLWFRATWEDASSPSIDVPLARLFGTSPEPASFDTLPMTVVAGDGVLSLVLRLPMPFASRAVLSLVNQGARDHRVRVDIDGSERAPGAEFGRLHAYTSQQSAPAADDRFVVAELSGRGVYAGAVFSFEGTEDPDYPFADPFNFLEGDDTLTVDGVAAPGTGTEEFVNGGFYFIDGPFDSLFAAALPTDTVPLPGGGTAGHARGVRWHVTSDAVRFEDSLRLEFEYGANRPRTMLEYSAVLFCYR